MLGKRCRTIQRTASISHNMGPQYSWTYYDSREDCRFPPSSKCDRADVQTSIVIPQIVGFTPTNRHSNRPASKCEHLLPAASPPPLWSHLQQMASNDPMVHQRGDVSVNLHGKLTQIAPWSALQTLLGGARTEVDGVGQTSHSDTGKELPIPNGITPNQLPASHAPTSGRQQSLGMVKGYREHQKSMRIIEVDSEAIFELDEGTSSSVDGGSLISSQSSKDYLDNPALYLATSPPMTEFCSASMSFLESCNLCTRPLGLGCDIFIYRGDNAFCSVECREKQMLLEEKRERLKQIPRQSNGIVVYKHEDHSKASMQRGSNGSPHDHHYQRSQNRKHHPHHHRYDKQTVAHNDRKHPASLLMPAA
ncbi:hypothetical protein KP509_16G075900 [Ceratopteris richardii]|uniref:FLZ-type domain-containing protein n=1 Tax=Ceratopteris richardii TaxID=49495 RepID=A0A8T2T4M2_CERRI|nr:hypothetical protein KP509_16G075900 [Ceratopteris richardii]